MLGWYCVIQVLDSLSSYYHAHILARQVAYFKALGRDTSILSYRERTNVATKDENNLHRRLNLSINVRDRDLLLVSCTVYLRFFSSVCIFLTFWYLSWATLWDVAFSDYYESILFHVGSSAFEISTKLAVIVAQ